MTANLIVHPAYYRRSTPFTRWVLKLRYPNLDWLPRKDVFICVILVLAGLSLPAAIACGLLMASFSLAFLGFALAAVGGVLVLIRCGEI